MKPGYKSTEFYLTLLSQVIGVVVLFGAITSEDAANISDAVRVAVEAVVGLSVAVAPLVQYIKSRTELKALE